MLYTRTCHWLTINNTLYVVHQEVSVTQINNSLYVVHQEVSLTHNKQPLCCTPEVSLTHNKQPVCCTPGSVTDSQETTVPMFVHQDVSLSHND